ncbi:hypothetical protein WJX72_003697 [[Myrmecia] bisecta]|uniref:chloroplast protein-transporting ATPase n=1 Tax=[Myrmecia] bisecta TaxID=41462 RepID=A0AAW1P8J6_9CHLO
MLNRFTQFNFGATIQHLLNKGEEQLSGLSIPDHWKTHLEKLPAGEKRTLDRYFRSVKLINDLEPQIQRLADEELKAKTDEFRARLAKGETLDDLLVEAFAVVREVARRVLSMRHFDVQLVGGMVLHEGQIAEMQTGEGKTLVATLPAYLNALEGKGVHIVTVNDYLAQRDAKWMGKVFKFLGLTVAVVTEKMEDPGIKLAFQADVTYITSQQLCFTYLRDNMTRLPSAIALTRPLHYAIVDEADNVLIDECRNPMLISTVSLAGIDRFQVAKQVADKLIECKVDDKTGRVTRAGHYLLDRRQKSVVMNEDGLRRALDILGETGHMTELEQRKGRKPEANDLWDDEVPWGPFIVDAVRAKELYLRDVDYIVRDGEAQIINPSTGRVMPVSRWTDNIHQAVEAKEGLEVRPDNMTQASVTFQCFFRYYQKLCGMTGTAATEASEFYETYGLNVARVPTNKPIRRLDNDWLLFLDEADKIDHIGVTVLRQYRGIRRPVLIGTTSVQESDKVAAELRRLNVPYRLLNARPENVRKEAAIIAQAGYPGSITIATNMAGRGTDIILGGNPKGLALTYLEMACMPLMLKDPKEHDGNMKSPLPHWPKDKAKAKAKDITKAKAKDKAKDKSRPGDVKVTSPRAGKVRKEGKADNLGEMEDYLPDEVVGKLKRVRAEIRIRLKACGLLMEFSDAQLFLQRGVDRAEELRLLLIAGAKAKLKSEIVTHDHDHPWTTMNTHEQRMDYLNEFCEADKSFSSQDGFVLEAVAYAALALWLWLDEECEESGEHVRELGGLLVIGASMQDCIRNENQLKGRAGRQGDPGESQMMADMDDKMLQFGSIRDLMNQAGLKTLDNRLTVYEGLPGKIAKRVCDGERRKQEGWMRSLREDTKRYDEVMEVFRQHAYSLRRLIVCGTPAQRTDILHSYMQDWADSLVDECVDPRRRPADWDWAVLAHKIRAVVNPPPPPIPPPLPATAVSKPGGTALTDTDPNAAAAQTVDGKPLAVPQSLVPWSIQMKVELADHRRMLSSGEANASRPPLAGQFAPQANALRNHLGELLMVAYAGKKHLIGMIGRPSQPSRPWCRAHAVAFVRNWEKEMMAEVMDALWVDFLRDMQNLQNAVNVRAFSRMEPLAEFRIDAGASFVSLLAAFRAECVIAAFTGPTADARFNVQLAEAQQMVDEDRLLSDAPPVDGPLDAVAKDKGADMPVPQARGATADPSVSLTS